MSDNRVVADACVMINLLATGREVEITRALGWSWLMSRRTREETLFLHSPPDGDGRRHRREIDFRPLEQAGVLSVCEPDSEWTTAFVRCAEHLPDGDAAAVALAGALGLPLATDDPKERRVAQDLFPALRLYATLGVLRWASTTLDLDEPALTRLALDLRWCGNFLPPRRDPDREWYENLLVRAGL